jgi:hypothetical protein
MFPSSGVMPEAFHEVKAKARPMQEFVVIKRFLIPRRKTDVKIGRRARGNCLTCAALDRGRRGAAARLTNGSGHA